MNAPMIKLGMNERAMVRKAISSHPRWSEYRKADGLRIENMTAETLLGACADLDIDLSKIMASAANYVPTPRPPVASAEIPSAPLSEKAVTMSVATTEKPAAAPAPKAANNSAASLLEAAMRAIAEQSSAPVDMDQVNDAIDVKMQALSAAVAETAASVVASALSKAPISRIEIKTASGSIREVKGHKHPKFATLARAVSVRMGNGFAPSVWLTGPAGSGKTHAGHMLADAFGVAFHVHGATEMPHELLGFIDAGGTYHRTPFREGYEHGGVVMLDECDAYGNGALLALNAGLANGSIAFPDAVVKRHADCIIIASANTFGLGATADYVGRSKIDAAFLSRFPVRIAWGYDEALEIAISGHEGFARRVIKARERAKTAGLKVLIDPRASQAGGALIAAGFTSNEAAELTYLANLTADQRRTVEG